MLLRAKLTFGMVSKVSKVSKVSIERFFASLYYFYIFKRNNINIFIYKYLYIPKKSFLLPQSTKLNKVQKYGFSLKVFVKTYYLCTNLRKIKCNF